MGDIGSSFARFLPSDTGTTRLGQRLAAQLGAGDTVLLSGPIGAGKTHLARAVILALLEAPEDIPSPTYTLVQTYDAPGFGIWHADLYRLTDTTELLELGLAEAFGSALVLVEWPDRLPDEMLPVGALHVHLTPQDGGRVVRMTGAACWDARLSDLAHA